MDIHSSSRNIFKGLHLGKMLNTFSVSQLCNISCINSCYFPLHPRRTEEADKLGSRVLTAETDGTLGKSLLLFGYLQCLAEVIEVLRYLSQKSGPS